MPSKGWVGTKLGTVQAELKVSDGKIAIRMMQLGKFGRGDRIRTYDPLRPRQVRYQAALRPDFQSIKGVLAPFRILLQGTEMEQGLPGAVAPEFALGAARFPWAGTAQEALSLRDFRVPTRFLDENR